MWYGTEHGTQAPGQTLELASGSCRDLAMLMIAGLRSLGIAARFVSGYLNTAARDEDDGLGGNTHAWVQAYIPGPGWCDFDPSSGIVGNRDLLRVAVARAPHEALPLQGTWFGAASDHLAMKVAVRVKAAEHWPEDRLRFLAIPEEPPRLPRSSIFADRSKP